jgi:hypothetical protein
MVWYAPFSKHRQLKDAIKEGKSRNPPRVKNRRTGGYDSKAEGHLYTEYLRPLEMAGEIKDIRHQHTVHMTRARIGYRADYSWVNCKTNETEYGEMKGFETELWLIKKKLWKYYGPGKLFVFKSGSKSRVYLAEEIVPK